MLKTHFYRIEVAPLTILPLKRSPIFSYFSRQDIPIGSLILIPFGKQELRGVVTTTLPLDTPPAAWMKEVRSLLVPQHLTQEQLTLAQLLSQEYFTPLGKTLVHFVTEDKKRVTTVSEPISIQYESKYAPCTQAPVSLKPFAALKRTLAPLSLPGQYALTIHPQKRDAALACIIRARLKRLRVRKTVLILIPEIFSAELLSASLIHFGIEHVLLSSTLPKKAFSRAWEQARVSGAVILGTRQALFAPFADLGTILLIDPSDDAYKQWDMSPRYNGRRVASRLAELFQADVISVSPFLDTIQEHAKASVEVKHIDLTHSLPLAPLEIINLRLERYRKNYAPLSIASREYIQHALIRQERVVLIANQSGYSKITICESCKKIYRCTQCQAIVHPEKSGRFSCSVCSMETSLFPSCPECGHLRFKQIGFGTERIEKEIHTLFPSAQVRRIDRNTHSTQSKRSLLVDQHVTGEADILIGVPSLLNVLDDERAKTFVFIDADTFLSWNDFRTDERFAWRVFRARLLAGATGKVFLETFQPENFFFRTLASESPEHLIRVFLQDRKALNYPPFSRLIVLEVLRDTQAQADHDTEKLEKSLRALPESEKWRIFVVRASSRHSRGRYVSYIVFRVPEAILPSQLTDWLSTLPKDTFIDRDPLSLPI